MVALLSVAPKKKNRADQQPDSRPKHVTLDSDFGHPFFDNDRGQVFEAHFVDPPSHWFPGVPQVWFGFPLVLREICQFLQRRHAYIVQNHPPIPQILVSQNTA